MNDSTTMTDEQRAARAAGNQWAATDAWGGFGAGKEARTRYPDRMDLEVSFLHGVAAYRNRDARRIPPI